MNVNNYPYEQNLSNNKATTEDTISVELEAMGMGTQSVTVEKGETAGFVLSGLPASGGVVRVTGADVTQIAAYGGNGAVPTSRTGGSPVQGGTAGPAVLLGGTTEPVVLPLADGSLLVVFPARAEGENAYLVLENGGNATTTVSVEVKETELKIYGATPGRIANAGEATVTITGSGLVGGALTDGHAGRVILPVVTLGGREAKSVEVLNAAQIAATFDVEGMAAGTYDIAASISGAAGSAALQNAIEVYTAKTGPKLRAWLEMPSSVRDGRVFTGYVCYANEGDSPMAMPVFKIARQDSNTKMGLVASENMTETTLYVGGISPTHPAGVLKVGDEARIPFYFQPLGTYKIKLSHIKDAEDLEAYPTFGGTKAYLAAMSAAATRLNLRGRTAYNIHDFVDQALWEKNDVAHAAVSGYLVDAKTGEPFANTSIALVDAEGPDAAAGDSRPPATGTTDESGYFQLTNLADGEYRWLMDSGVMLADASTNTLTIADQADVNGATVSATPGGRISGYVLTATGEPVAYGTVALLDAGGSISTAVETDGFGVFTFNGLSDGAYSVQAMPKDGYMVDAVTNVIIDSASRSTEVTFALERGARISGVVTFNCITVTNGTVQAITEDGVSFEVLCATNGVYLFDGLAAGSYAVRYYTNTASSDDADVVLSVGDDTTVDLVAKERPLFISTRSVGFGSCEAKFIFTDSKRAEKVSAWAWDFDFDGVVDSTDVSPTWNYTQLGTNTVTLVITEDGKRTTSVYRDCVRVEAPIETILVDNAILFGTNSGTLQPVSMGDGTLVLSGNPASGILEPGMVLMGQCGDDWFCRRIVSAVNTGGQWTLTTELAGLEDVYTQYAVSFAVPATLGKATQANVARPRLMSAKRASNDKDGTRAYINGGFSMTSTVDPELIVEFVREMRNGKKYEKYGIVGRLNLASEVSLHGTVGFGHKKTYPTPLDIIIPTAIPGVTVHADGAWKLEIDAHVTGKVAFNEWVRPAVHIGAERYDNGKWKWQKPFDAEGDWTLDGDVEGEFSVKASFEPRISLKVLETASTALGMEGYLKFSAKASAKAPVTAAISAGLEAKAEFNAVDWKIVKIGAEFTLGALNWDLIRLTGPDPDFDYEPSVKLEAPASVSFVNKSKGSTLRGGLLPGVYLDQSYEPSGYEWDLGNGFKSNEKNPSTTYTREGRYKVYLKARGDFLNGPYRKRKDVTVGNPDEIPDDGDEETDDTEQDTGKQSCDPNEVNGPMGVGEARFVKPGQELTYTIYFENKAGFDIADAQEVRVTNPLSEWLDWSTFEMREVAFNNQNDNGLFGLACGMNDVKMTGADKYVRVALGGGNDGAGTIAATGVAHWYMRVYDPNGNFGWPNDLSGFLPSNDDTHRGEGHITYRIKVREDAPANVVITNSASIVFDKNDPIETDPAWWNTVGSLGAAFVESEVEANEGETVTISVSGGNAEGTASVKVYLTYNTAAAADVDLKTASIVDCNRLQSTAADDESAVIARNLKFPLTLAWETGEVGEKVIKIPVKADKTVENDEFFTLQLADAQGMELGDDRVCTVTIHDPGYDELGAKVAAGTASKTEKSAWDKLQKAKAPYIRGLADPANAGKVTGSGLCADGKKVTLKATANKGFVFVGWLDHSTAIDGNRLLPNAIGYTATTPSLVIDRSAKPAKDSATSTTITNVTDDVTYYACFITSEEDKASIVSSVDGWQLEPWVSKTETHAFATNIWEGVYLEWPVAASALSSTTVKVAGLPAGLKFTDKPVTGKVGTGKTAVVVTNVPANTIYGAPTAASKVGRDGKPTPSAVKVTVTTAGKSSQTYQMDVTVDALPAWAVGTFDGVVFSSTDGSPVQDQNAQAARSTSGIVQSFTVASNGKISGKLLEGGLAWSLGAPYFSDAESPVSDVEGTESSPVFHATVIGKSGKAEITNDVTVAIDEAARSASVPYQRGVVNGQDVRSPSATGETPVVPVEWAAWQNLWKTEPWKTEAKAFAKAPALTVGEVTLKFAASGAVTASGKFVTGKDAKGKDVVYSATCSSVLIPSGARDARPYLDGGYSVFIYFPPKAGKFDGYSAEIPLVWDGTAFSPQ